MNKETKYRLKKDLPEIKAGSFFILVENSDVYECGRESGKYTHLPTSYVENNPDWFEPIEDEIRVVGIWKYQKSETFDSMFSTNKEFSNEKYPLIKQAIENIINDKIS